MKSRGIRFIGVSRRFCDSAHMTKMSEGPWEVVGLILSRLLPLDIRVRESAWLYEVKRGKDLGDTFVDRELERLVYFGDLPHPAHVPEIGYESVEDIDSQTIRPSRGCRAADLHRRKPN
ncbi:hypothetical protein EVAR_85142_1 [Eumeta japonica]|uniref:Uncharacterized protein n=1 Tax=Eumeta variegata TaxID=151549 RepID=A0A4C1XTJ5_EUMVA|nr:hypothetical protein EVAR_85142_1 [Eumeta japonica]